MSTKVDVTAVTAKADLQTGGFNREFAASVFVGADKLAGAFSEEDKVIDRNGANRRISRPDQAKERVTVGGLAEAIKAKAEGLARITNGGDPSGERRNSVVIVDVCSRSSKRKVFSKEGKSGAVDMAEGVDVGVKCIILDRRRTCGSEKDQC